MLKFRLKKLMQSIGVVLLFPITLVLSLLLYPNMVLRLFSPQGKGYKVERILDKQEILVYLPGNAGARRDAFYAFSHLLWPFFSLDDHAKATVEHIKRLDNEVGGDRITIASMSMGGAAAVLALAELIRQKKDEGLSIKPLYVIVQNTFSSLNKVVEHHLNKGRYLYFTKIQLVLSILIFLLSFFITIPSSTYFLMSSVVVLLCQLMLMAIMSELDENTGSPIILNYLLYPLAALSLLLTPSVFVYIPIALMVLLDKNISHYTVPFFLGIMGCNSNVREAYNYIKQHIGSVKDVTLDISQMASEYDKVLGDGILLNKKDSVEAKCFLDPEGIQVYREYEHIEKLVPVRYREFGHGAVQESFIEFFRPFCS